MRENFSWRHASQIWITLTLIVVLMIALMKSCPQNVYDPSALDRQTCSARARNATDYANCVTVTRQSVRDPKARSQEQR